MSQTAQINMEGIQWNEDQKSDAGILGEGGGWGGGGKRNESETKKKGVASLCSKNSEVESTLKD